LSHEVEVVRERMLERDRDVRDLQNALKGLESDKRRIGDDHMDDRRSLELEIDRVKRDLVRSQDDLEHAQQEVDRLESSLSQQRAELSEMASQVALHLPSGSMLNFNLLRRKRRALLSCF
jgi:chromosome segregation ATPase